MVNDNDTDAFDWTVRNAVYAAILERGLPPTAEEAAAALGVRALTRSRIPMDGSTAAMPCS